MIRRISALVILVLALSCLLQAQAEAAEGCTRCDQGTGHVEAGSGSLDTHAGVGVTISNGGITVAGSQPGGGSATGPIVEYKYDPVCDGTCHSADAQATADLANCTGDQVAVWVTSRVVGSGLPFASDSAPQCLTPAQQMTYDPAQLQTMVAEYFKRLPLPEPGLHIAPDDNAVVNLPEIVSADAPGRTTFTVAQAPFPVVTITAAVQWEWNFGDGTTLVTDSPGKAYDGTDPASGGYITHTYTSANKAWPLSVTSIWTATYTVQGVAGVQTVADSVQRTSVRPLAAADYGSVLTAN